MASCSSRCCLVGVLGVLSTFGRAPLTIAGSSATSSSSTASSPSCSLVFGLSSASPVYRLLSPLFSGFLLAFPPCFVRLSQSLFSRETQNFCVSREKNRHLNCHLIRRVRLDSRVSGRSDVSNCMQRRQRCPISTDASRKATAG